VSDKTKLRVWWIPQVPMAAFTYPVDSIATGKVLLDVLAKYDAFQYENRVKPDYCNAGGMSWSHPVATEGEWYDFDPEDEDELAEVTEADHV